MFLANAAIIFAANAVSPKGCGKTLCDADMKLANSPIGAFHVPNLKQVSAAVPATAWSTNKVGSGKTETIVTTLIATKKTTTKFGSTCAQAKKDPVFLGSGVLALGAPSWIAKLSAATDLDAAGNLIGGATFKLDVLPSDLKLMNDAATASQAACRALVGCKYVTYGYEAGAWFYKLFSNDFCVSPTGVGNPWFKAAAPATSPATVFGPVPNTNNLAGGCRVTDTIPINTPTLAANTKKIAATTARTLNLPYLTLASYTLTGPVASIKCDSPAGGITPGYPTFGVTWV